LSQFQEEQYCFIFYKNWN